MPVLQTSARVPTLHARVRTPRWIQGLPQKGPSLNLRAAAMPIGVALILFPDSQQHILREWQAYKLNRDRQLVGKPAGQRESGKAHQISRTDEDVHAGSLRNRTVGDPFVQGITELGSRAVTRRREQEIDIGVQSSKGLLDF